VLQSVTGTLDTGSTTPMPHAVEMADHAKLMRLALEEARRAAERGDTAVAALIARGDEVVSIAGSTVRTRSTPLGHAELVAIADACSKLGRSHLSDCTLYSTMEPCPMCGWAIHLAGLRAVVLGARHAALGRLDLGTYSLERLMAMTGQRIELITGVLKEECEAFRRDWSRRTGRLS
jgi:tRNA(Arg) A34 adenosine deaminase TadA